MPKEQNIREKAYQVFVRDGYKGTTIESIAKAAGVSKTSVHYYFRSKDILYQMMVEKIGSELLQPVEIHFSKLIFLVHELRSNKKKFLNALEQAKNLPWEMIIKRELQKRVPCVDHDNFWKNI